MQRVGSNRNPALDLFGAGKHGFTAGNPQTGTPATTPGAEFFNAIQEELANAIEGLGGVLDPNKRDQLKTVLTGLASLSAAQLWTKGQRGAVVALAYAAIITPDLNASNNFASTLTGNATLANPANVAPGQSGVIQITQDATGSRVLAYGSYFKFVGGVIPQLSTTANAVDLLTYYVVSPTQIYVSLMKDIR